MRIFLIAAVAVLVASCSPAGLLNGTVSAAGVRETRDLAYGAGPLQKLDVYQPEPRGEPGPLVVFLYGGSWRMGSKDMYPFVGRPLAQRGAVVVVPDYRLYPEVRFPDFLDDNAQAVAWAIAHAASLGANPRRVFIVGHSAGAYNAVMLAVDGRYLARAGVARSAIAGVVGMAGPYNFLPIMDPDVIPVFASVDDGPASQPITYVDGSNPALLLMAGEADTTVNPQNTVSMAARVAARGGSVETKLYPGVGHIGLITAIAPLFSERAPVLDDLWSFIQRH